MHERISNLIEKINYKDLSTIKAGPNIINCYFPKDNKDLLGILENLKERPIVLGGLSNILLSEDLALYPSFISLKHFTSANSFGANTPLSCLKIASLYGIPGTLGGAITSNAGAFGSCIADFIKEVNVLEISSLSFKTLSKKECRFSYRDSLFKQTKDYIILSAQLDYVPSSDDEIIKVQNQRKEKELNIYPSLGSFFKNPKGSFAGKLLENANLKGYTLKNAKVSEKHANIITNPNGKATSKEIFDLSQFCIKTIKELYKINLEYEVELYGFNSN